MKKYGIAAFFTGAAISVQAGSITYEAPQDVIIKVDPNSGIGGNWIIPAVSVAVLALVVLKPGAGQ